MSKLKDRQIKGCLVPTEPVFERRIATVLARPLRLAFVINETEPTEQLFRYIEYNSIIWGGYYNVFLPTDGKTLRIDWRQTLSNYDPDLVILCGEMEEELIKELNVCCYPYYMWKWSDNVISKNLSGNDPFGCIPVIYHRLHLYQENRPIAQSNVRIPQIQPSSPYYECAAAQFGTLPERYISFDTEALKAEMVELSDDSLEAYLACVSELDSRLTPIRLTKSDLSLVTYDPLTRFAIVITRGHLASDLCLFWDLRMWRSLGYKGTLLLPFSVLTDECNAQILAQWCNKSVQGTNNIALASTSVCTEQLLGLREQLLHHLDLKIEFVDIWFSNFTLGSIYVYGVEKQEEISLEDRRFRLGTPRPAFAEHLRYGKWVIDIDFGKVGYATQGFVPPQYEGLSNLLSGDPEDWVVKINHGLSVRLASEHLSYRVDHRQQSVVGRIPTETEVFSRLLQNNGYRVITTDKCRYIEGMSRLIEDLQEFKVWRDGKVRDLFYAMQDGTAYTPSEMMSYLKPGSNSKEAYSMVADLARKRVFLRGFTIKCPACDLARWYPTGDVAEVMSCAGCLTRLQPPIEAPFHYRLNDLVSRGIDQGSVSVLLTVLFFQALARKSFLFVPGFEVCKAEQAVDLDIVASCDGHLFVAECKDIREEPSPETVEAMALQLTSIVEVARDIDAEAVFLSMLVDSVPTYLQNQIDLLNDEMRESLAVHMIICSDLERGYRSKQSPILDDSAKEQRASVEDFLPHCIPLREGWIKESGQREFSF